MTVHTAKHLGQAGGTAPPAVSRLRIREAALRQQAAQLHARAEHLQRLGRVQEQQLTRRIDAHEKIVLGALVKKAGMAISLSKENQQSHDDVSIPVRRGLGVKAAQYDRALVLGALLWLSSALNRPSGDIVTTPDWDKLRDDGQQALAHVCD